MTTSGSTPSGREAAEKVREHRTDLEALAETKLPVAPWATRLLALLNETESNGNDEGVRRD